MGRNLRRISEGKIMKLKIPISFIAVSGLLAGCAFDISHVRQLPITFTSNTDTAESFILNQDVKATLGTGFATRLKAGTRWQQVGNTEYGKVFVTKDQIVTVEASNIYEAELVVSNQCISGFYLIVEKKFAPVTRPIHIEIQTSNLNSNKSQ
jgi:hypothetical protein